jgi:hypothetical protein
VQTSLGDVPALAAGIVAVMAAADGAGMLILGGSWLVIGLGLRHGQRYRPHGEPYRREGEPERRIPGE